MIFFCSRLYGKMSNFAASKLMNLLINKKNQIMKKTYFKPKMEIYELNNAPVLLAGSNPQYSDPYGLDNGELG